MKIYLAGPISGKSYDEVINKFNTWSYLLSDMGYVVLNPMSGKGYLSDVVKLEPTFKKEDIDDIPTASDHFIFKRDKWMVQQCDIILADLSTSNRYVSIGTMMELAWASMLGKHTITIMRDDDIHNHAFVNEASDVIFRNIVDAIDYLRDLCGKSNE